MDSNIIENAITAWQTYAVTGKDTDKYSVSRRKLTKPSIQSYSSGNFIIIPIVQ